MTGWIFPGERVNGLTRAQQNDLGVLVIVDAGPALYDDMQRWRLQSAVERCDKSGWVRYLSTGLRSGCDEGWEITPEGIARLESLGKRA